MVKVARGGGRPGACAAISRAGLLLQAYSCRGKEAGGPAQAALRNNAATSAHGRSAPCSSMQRGPGDQSTPDAALGSGDGPPGGTWQSGDVARKGPVTGQPALNWATRNHSMGLRTTRFKQGEAGTAEVAAALHLSQGSHTVEGSQTRISDFTSRRLHCLKLV